MKVSLIKHEQMSRCIQYFASVLLCLSLFTYTADPAQSAGTSVKYPCSPSQGWIPTGQIQDEPILGFGATAPIINLLFNNNQAVLRICDHRGRHLADVADQAGGKIRILSLSSPKIAGEAIFSQLTQTELERELENCAAVVREEINLPIHQETVKTARRLGLTNSDAVFDVCNRTFETYTVLIDIEILPELIKERLIVFNGKVIKKEVTSE